MNRWLAMLCALVAFTLARGASAAPSLKMMADQRRLEVNDHFEVTLSVSIDDASDNVHGCKLFTPGAFHAQGPQMGQSTTMTIVGNQFVRQNAITCTWDVKANTVGTFNIGPGSATVNGHELKGDSLSIQVVPAGSAPTRPFDPFRQLLRDFQQHDFDPDPEIQVPLEPRFALETAPDTLAFLHATVDTTNVVVGQQVTLDLYLYLDATLTREPDITDLHEPGTSDFLRENLLDAQMNTESVGYAKAGSRIYAVKRVRRYALFPLTTGDLAIEPMRLTVGRSGERLSEKLKVHVTEPPVAGRPPGYAIGDVGTMTLNAVVEPRTAPRGGAIAVTVVLAGAGNLPTALTPPTRPGVEWLTPEVRSEMKGNAGVWGGTRTFTYVVRPTKQGKLDLGALALPYWDPGANAYAMARAELGEIDVTAGQGQTDDALRLFDGLPAPRRTFAPAKSGRYLADGPLFFPLLLLPTAAFGLVVVGSRLRERQRRRSAEREASPHTALEEKLSALERAARDTDARALDAATMRVIEAATIAHLGLNVRGVGHERVQDACVDAGATKEAAGTIRDLLEECAAARFAPTGAELEDARKRSAKARALVTQLGKAKR